MTRISPKSLVCLVFILSLVSPVISHSGDHSNQNTQTILEDHLSSLEEYDENNDNKLGFNENLEVQEAETEGNLATKHQDAAIKLYNRDAELTIDSGSRTQTLEEGWLSINEGDILTRDDGYPGYNVEIEATEISENGGIILSVNGEYEVEVNKGETVTGEELFGELGDLAGRGGAGLGNCGVVQRGTDRFTEGEANLYFDSTTATSVEGPYKSEEVSRELDRCLNHRAENTEKTIQGNKDTLYLKGGQDYTLTTDSQEVGFRAESLAGGTESIGLQAIVSDQEFDWSTGQDFYIGENLFLELGNAERSPDRSRFFKLKIKDSPDNYHQDSINNLFYVNTDWPDAENFYLGNRKVVATQDGNIFIDGGETITSNGEEITSVREWCPLPENKIYSVNEKISLEVTGIECGRNSIHSSKITVLNNDKVDIEKGRYRINPPEKNIQGEDQFKLIKGQRGYIKPYSGRTPVTGDIHVTEFSENSITINYVSRLDGCWKKDSSIQLNEGDYIQTEGNSMTINFDRIGEGEHDVKAAVFRSEEGESRKEIEFDQIGDECSSNDEESQDDQESSEEAHYPENSQSPEGPARIGDASNYPVDPDDDGLYEDVNGDGELTVSDPELLFYNTESAPAEYFDFNEDGDMDVADAQALYNFVSEEPRENSITVQTDNIQTGAEVGIQIETKLTLADKGYQIVVENPEGEKILEQTSQEITQTNTITPEETGEYTVNIYPTGRIQSIISRVTGPLMSRTFAVSSNKPEWVNYCRNNDYDTDSIQQKANCIKQEIIPEYFEDSVGDNPEVAESLCRDLLSYSYSGEENSCKP